MQNLGVVVFWTKLFEFLCFGFGELRKNSLLFYRTIYTLGANIWLKGRLMTALRVVSLDWNPTDKRTLTES